MSVSSSAMYWYNYEKGKAWLCKHNNIREPTFAITFISGAVSGSVSILAVLSAQLKLLCLVEHLDILNIEYLI